MEEEYGKEKANKIKGNITKTLNKRTIQNQYIEEHLNGTMKELERLEKEGFKCISLVKRPIPDIIAIKDEKIYAIEVEYLHKGKNKGCVAYDKYNNITYYDDIKWIFKESEVNKRNENWDD